MPYLVKKIGHSIAHGYVPQAPIIVDLGMHEGEFAAEIHEVWPDAKVYGCEPVPRWFEKLSAAGANVLNVAIGGKAGRAEISIYENFCASTTFHQLEKGPKVEKANVEVVTLKDLLDRFGLTRVSVLKVDIEGAELDLILQSNLDTLTRCDQVTVEFHDFIDRAQVPGIKACMVKMREAGFAKVTCSFATYGDILFVQRRLFHSALDLVMLQVAAAGSLFSVSRLRDALSFALWRVRARRQWRQQAVQNSAEDRRGRQ